MQKPTVAQVCLFYQCLNTINYSKILKYTTIMTQRDYVFVNPANSLLNHSIMRPRWRNGLACLQQWPYYWQGAG